MVIIDKILLTFFTIIFFLIFSFFSFIYIENLVPVSVAVLNNNSNNNANNNLNTNNISESREITDNLQKPLQNPPEIIKAVYVTSWSAGSKHYLAYLDDLFKTTQINAVVVDIKDSSGLVVYESQSEEVKKYGLYRKTIKDIDAFVNDLHSKNIYVIGRIVVFLDSGLARVRPDLAIHNKLQTQNNLEPVLWKDSAGSHWLDAASKEVQDYNISIARDALNHGFDEINFDYVRFPSDGDLKNSAYPIWDGKISRDIVIKDFFRNVRESLPEHKLSVDLFGQTATSKNDMGVGQIIENAFEYFDYLCLMIYPSHYISGFLGYPNPAEYPYEVVKNQLDSAVKRRMVYSEGKNSEIKLAKIRPWLQDFDLGAIYDAAMVKKEINAVTDAMGSDFNGFYLWNPSNIYTADAIIKDPIF